jgi:hypothetical protein
MRAGLGVRGRLVNHVDIVIDLYLSHDVCHDGEFLRRRSSGRFRCSPVHGRALRGQVNAILTAAGPPSTIYMGLGIGTYSSGTCTLLSGGSVITQAGSVAQLSGTINAGSYCVQVYDAGNQSVAVSYTVTVNHY